MRTRWKLAGVSDHAVRLSDVALQTPLCKRWEGGRCAGHPKCQLTAMPPTVPVLHRCTRTHLLSWISRRTKGAFFFFLTLHGHQLLLLGQGGDSAAARAEGDGAVRAFACCYWWWICGLDHGPVYLNKGILRDAELAVRWKRVFRCQCFYRVKVTRVNI